MAMSLTETWYLVGTDGHKISVPDDTDSEVICSVRDMDSDDHMIPVLLNKDQVLLLEKYWDDPTDIGLSKMIDLLHIGNYLLSNNIIRDCCLYILGTMHNLTPDRGLYLQLSIPVVDTILRSLTEKFDYYHIKYKIYAGCDSIPPLYKDVVWTIRFCVKHGYLDVLKCLHRVGMLTGEIVGKSPIPQWVAKHLDIVQWLSNVFPQEFEHIGMYGTIFSRAARYGHLEVLKWLNDQSSINIHPRMGEHAFYQAMMGNHLSIMQWVHQTMELGQLYVWNQTVFSAVIRNGWVHILMWLSDNRIIIPPSFHEYLYQCAAEFNQLEVLKWLLEFAPPVRGTVNIISYAIEGGNMEMLEWVETHADELMVHQD